MVLPVTLLLLLLAAAELVLGVATQSHTCSDTMLNAKTQFGAVGDGVTDDSASLQSAIDAAVACGGKAVFVPVGTYVLTRSLQVSGHMQMLGEGASGSCHGLDTNVSAANMRGTVLLQTNSSADGIYVSVGSHCESVQLHDFSLVARPVHSTGAAVRVVGLENNMCDGKIERLLIENWETGVHCLACQNAALNDLKIRRPWGTGIIIEGDPHISWDQDAAGDSRIAGLDYFGCQRNGGGGGHDGCSSHAAIEYRNGGAWFISQGKYLLGDYGLLLNQTRGPTGTLIVTGNSFEEQLVSSIAFVLGTSENLTYSSYANVIISNNELSNLNDNQGAHIIIEKPRFNKTEEPDPVWIRNLVVTGNVINSAVNATIPLIHVTSTEGAVIANNVINNNGCPGPSAIFVDNKTVTGLKCRNNAVWTEDLVCVPAECCY